jgi:hypothetical protein
MTNPETLFGRLMSRKSGVRRIPLRATDGDSVANVGGLDIRAGGRIAWNHLTYSQELEQEHAS